MTHSSASVSKKALWTGYVLTVAPALLLIFSAIMKLMKPEAVVEGFEKFGIPGHLIILLGILELACTILYLIPRTSVLGAILLTGYLGGAVLTNLRVGEHIEGAVIIGVVLWGGLFFRDPRIRALIPLRK